MCAWTAPRTWVLNEVVTNSIMNTHLRDNQNAYSLHTHSGAAGDGNDELAGVDSISMDNIGDPSAPGASKTILYTATSDGRPKYRAGAGGSATELGDNTHASRHDSGGADAMAVDQAAGTPSLRSLSTTSTTAAPGDHTHVLTDEGSTTPATNEQNASVVNTVTPPNDGTFDTSVSTTEADFVAATDHTPAATGNSVAVIWSYMLTQGSAESGGTSTASIRLKKDAATVVTQTTALTGDGGNDGWAKSVEYVDASPTVASHAYLATHQITTRSQAADIVGGTVGVTEFSQT